MLPVATNALQDWRPIFAFPSLIFFNSCGHQYPLSSM